MPPLSVFVYWCFSFIAVDYVLQLFLLPESLELKLKLQKYSFRIKIICMIIICVIFSLYFIRYMWESVTYSHLLGGPIASITHALLRKLQKEDCVAINKCQKDVESIGAFWAHQAYDAYYEIVLQNVKERMTIFEEQNDIKFLVKKLIIIVPLSCDVKETLTDKDMSIKEIGILPIIECDQGANINRQLKNPVWRIKTSLKTEYIAAEYSGSLNTLWKTKNSFTKEKFKYHRDCFIKSLKFLVRDSPCIVIEYDDTIHSPKPLSSFLLSTLKKEESTIILPME